MVSYIDLSYKQIYFFIRKKSIYLLQMESVPYDKRTGKIWFNGHVVDWKDANIHISQSWITLRKLRFRRRKSL